MDVDEPMVGLNLHIYRDRAVLSLESSGESLHKRGYRPILTKAPLNEALAAALVLLTGWKRRNALRRSAVRLGHAADRGGVDRAAPAAGPDAQALRLSGLDGLRRAAVDGTARRGPPRRRHEQLPAPILGSDVRGDAVSFAINNARAAGIGHLLRFDKRDMRRLSAAGRAAGRDPVQSTLRRTHRRGTGADWAVSDARRIVRPALPGWTAFVFTGNPALADAIGLRPAAQIPLFNGKIPCRLLRFDMK